MPFFTALLIAQATAVPNVPPPADPRQDAKAEVETLGPVAAVTAGDVVVTARRRTESVQKVPIAVSVIGESALIATGSYNVSRLTQIQPSLQFYSTNPRNSAANIRGLGAPFGLTNDGIEQGVGIYVDQVYNARIAAATFDFTDTQRIEVLRGPQGTLYGKNTTAGAINVTSRPPSFEPEGRVELTGGDLDFFQGKASVSGPIVDDKLAVRLSTSITSRRGTIYNARTDKHQNAQDNRSVRGQLLWRPREGVDLTLYADYNRQDPECCVQYYVRTGATQRPLNRQYAALAAAQGYAVPSTDPFDRVTDIDSPLRAKQELGGVSLVANWDVGPATLTSVTAWRYWDWLPSNDRDFIGLPITPKVNNPSQQEQFTQELRLASNGAGALDYVAGLFYFDQQIDTQGVQVQGPAASRYLLGPPAAGCTPTSTANACDPAVLDGLTSTNTIGFTNTSAALFGKLTWRVTDRLSVSPGLRLNYDKKDGSYVSVVTTGAGGLLNCSQAAQGASTVTRDRCGVLAPQSYRPKFDQWNLSGDFTVAYAATDDVNAYATYARSYKSGGINLSGLPLDAANDPILATATVRPEKVDHFELGLKTQFLDRRVTVNLAAFRTEIANYQATVNNQQVNVIRGYLANAGKVRTQGLEADTALRPTDRLSLYANGAFTDAKYRRFPNAPCPPELSGGPALGVDANGAVVGTPGAAGQPGGASPPFCDISGQVLPGISKWAFSYGAEYNLPVRPFGAAGFAYAGFDGSYRSRFSSNPSRSAYTEIGGYSIANFRVGFREADASGNSGGWNVFGWLRNAFDEEYFDVLATQAGSTGLIVGQPGDPRTYGLTVSRRF
ncbi:TonB-dependent receptor [uncultured Sphingomonas sp.]|uniref:TonB-dependent receptor n=1 Tax=uncultured Sphingomonas sp. TaxID=158754 RepID=UPI0035CA5DD8